MGEKDNTLDLDPFAEERKKGSVLPGGRGPFDGPFKESVYPFGGMPQVTDSEKEAVQEKFREWDEAHDPLREIGEGTFPPLPDEPAQPPPDEPDDVM